MIGYEVWAELIRRDINYHRKGWRPPDRQIKPNEIANIKITMGRSQVDVLTNDRPKTGLEAKCSEQFAMPAAVILGRMGVAEVTDQVAQRPDFQAFYPKVKLNLVDEFDGQG